MDEQKKKECIEARMAKSRLGRLALSEAKPQSKEVKDEQVKRVVQGASA